MSDWNEARMDVISANGNDGLHYEDVEFLKSEIERLKNELALEKSAAEFWRETADTYRTNWVNSVTPN